jgi:hypothetical protein
MKVLGDQEAARGDPGHEESYQKTDLVIEVSIESLKGKDNR